MTFSLPRKAHWSPGYIYLQSAVIAALTWYYSRGFYVDDAYISLRYAHNLLAGDGLTWNPGERVEGYSNFLFLLLTAGLGALGMDLVLASRVVSFAAFFGLLAVLGWYTRAFVSQKGRSYAESICAALCVGLALSNVPLLAWCLGGLEGTLFAFFATWSVCLTLRLLEGQGCVRTAFGIGVLLAMAAMTRLDGALFLGFILGFFGLLWLVMPGFRHGLHMRRMMAMVAGFALLALPYMVWRVWYFGEWLPNTYYAKTYGIDAGLLWPKGAFYLLQAFYVPPMLGAFALAVTAIVWRQRRRLPVDIVFLGGLSLVLCAYVIRVGGDHMPYLRFVLPLYPVMILLIYRCGLRIIERNEALFRDLCGSLLVLSVFQFGIVDTEAGLSHGALSGLAVSDYIGGHWPKASTVAVGPAGSLPYAQNEYTYIDTMGLVDKHIARRVFMETEYESIASYQIGHMKGDGAYVLARKPDYIIFGYLWGSNEPLFLTDKEISRHPKFSEYEKVETYIDPPAALLPELKRLYKSALSENEANAPVYGPFLNERDQLRFIYFRRKE